MRLEVQRAFKRRAAKERKAELRRELNPATSLQPKERALRYENIRSARAEEGLLRLLLLDETLFPAAPPLSEEEFSSALLGKVFFLLWQAHEEGRSVSLNTLTGELSPEEMSHITSVCHQPESLRNGAKALADYINIIRSEAKKRAGGEIDPLLAAAEKYKNKKGSGGKQS
jgi:DNA primase